MDSEELQDRRTRAHQARTYGDLERLLSDLPGSHEPEQRTVAEHTVPETLHITASLRKARREARKTTGRTQRHNRMRAIAPLNFGSIWHEQP